MKRKKNKTEPLQERDSLAHLDRDYVASATDCTGLIPSAPTSDDEVDAYAQIYHIPHPQQMQGTPIQPGGEK